MTLDPRRAELWRAMKLGPMYELRSSIEMRSAFVADSVEAGAAITTNESLASTSESLALRDRATKIGALAWSELREEVARCRA